MKTGESDPFVS